MEKLYIKQHILTKEDINALLEDSGRLTKAFVTTRDASKVTDNELRSATVKQVIPKDHPSVNKKLMSLCAAFNSDVDVDTHYVKEYNFLIYGKGDHFTWHKDQIPESNGKERMYSSSTILSLTEDLEGGEFQIRSGDGYEGTVNIQAGETLLFSAKTHHCVLPVTQGKRIVLVAWIYNK
jgi:predicted 2-oxoglutarate/Fe(II)-dependent dioxygenase YbiX